MSETSLHYCVSEIATLWYNGELHLFSHQRLYYYCAEKVYLHRYTPRIIRNTIQFFFYKKKIKK